MNAEHFALDDSTNSKQVEHIHKHFPGVGVTVLAHNLIVESIGLTDLSGFMVTSDQSYVTRVFYF